MNKPLIGGVVLVTTIAAWAIFFRNKDDFFQVPDSVNQIINDYKLFLEEVSDENVARNISNLCKNKNEFNKNIKELELQINNTPLKGKIEALFLDKFSDKSFFYQSNNNIPIITYYLEDIIINYEHTNDNFINRKIELKINCILKSNDRIILLNKDTLTYNDTIPFELLEQFQSVGKEENVAEAFETICFKHPLNGDFLVFQTTLLNEQG